MSVKAIRQTDFNFPGQTAVYHGKVRDVYTIADKYIVAVATDRISAFDVILPEPIPFKGQVLNQIAAHFLKTTADIAPNWLINVPDPNVSLGYKLEPFRVEMIVRGILVGSAWRSYQAGKREICGVSLPEDMQEYDAFPEPIITPTTKADEGHDEDISLDEIINQGLATKQELDQLCSFSLGLFKHGQTMASKQNLLLADTKYEFGKQNGKIYLIDEVHTPDSSRYFYLDSYKKFLKDRTTELPRHLSKEFVREWLMDNGFSGNPGETMPEMTEKIVTSISERYLELFEQLTGQQFERPSESVNIEERIQKNVVAALEKI